MGIILAIPTLCALCGFAQNAIQNFIETLIEAVKVKLCRASVSNPVEYPWAKDGSPHSIGARECLFLPNLTARSP